MTQQYPPIPEWLATPPPPPAPRKRKVWLAVVAGAVAALVVGVGIGNSGGSDAATTPTATRVTTTETVTEVPQSCLDALRNGDRLIALGVKALGHASKAIAAISDSDVAGIERQAAAIRALTPQTTIARSQYDAASSDCRSAAR